MCDCLRETAARASVCYLIVDAEINLLRKSTPRHAVLCHMEKTRGALPRKGKVLHA